MSGGSSVVVVHCCRMLLMGVEQFCSQCRGVVLVGLAPFVTDLALLPRECVLAVPYAVRFDDARSSVLTLLIFSMSITRLARFGIPSSPSAFPPILSWILQSRNVLDFFCHRASRSRPFCLATDECAGGIVQFELERVNGLLFTVKQYNTVLYG